MSVFIHKCVRCLVCWALLIVLPASLQAQTPAAILHTQGGVWVNGNEAADSTAVFLGDVIETKPGFSATIALDGTSALLQPESVAKLEDGLLELDHGGVSVGTGKEFRVRVNCLTVIPIVNDWTQYDVTDVNGTVHVIANKKDVNVHHGVRGKTTPAQAAEQAAQSASVHEGEKKDYGESEACGGAAPPNSAASGIPTKWIAVGAGAGGGLLLLLLLHGGSPKTSISPSSP